MLNMASVIEVVLQNGRLASNFRINSSGELIWNALLAHPQESYSSRSFATIQTTIFCILVCKSSLAHEPVQFRQSLKVLLGSIAGKEASQATATAATRLKSGRELKASSVLCFVSPAPFMLMESKTILFLLSFFEIQVYMPVGFPSSLPLSFCNFSFLHRFIVFQTISITPRAEIHLTECP